MTASFRHSRSSRPLATKRPASRRLLVEGLEPRQLMAIAGLGIAGDSWSDDEYAGQNFDPSGTNNNALNWVDLLRTQRGVDLGPVGPYLPTEDDPFEHRGQGTAFNWANTDAATLDVLIQGHDIGILNQFDSGDVSHAVLFMGNIDLQPNSLTTIDPDLFKDNYAKIYLGQLSESQIDQNVITPITSNFEAGLSLLTSEAIDVVVATIPDPGVTPHARANFPDAARRAQVTNVINTINTRIKQIAAKYHVPVADLAKLSENLLGTSTAPAATRSIGGRIFDNAAGNPRTNLFVSGGKLPHTVYQAYIANTIIEALNVGYGESLDKFSEQQIVQLAGQSYGGTDTFVVNYRNLVILPPTTVFVDFGHSSTVNDDFTQRMNELTTARGINPLSSTAGGELETLKANIVSRLSGAFSGLTVNFSGTRPSDTRYETIKLGRLSSSVPGPLTSTLGQGSFDWLNANENSIGFVFPDLINFNLSTLTRAEQLRYIENILVYFVAQETGRGMGLSSADAYGYSQITTANQANTGGTQLLDYMSGSTALGFNLAVFNGTPSFKFSPLALAKLQMGHWLHSKPISPVAESIAAHGTPATAQVVPLSTTTGNASLKVANVKTASITTGGQSDWYKLSLSANDLLTAQTIATGLYGDAVPPAIDTVIKIFGPDGTTLVIESDNTLLGNNSFGQAGTTKVDDDSMVLNYVAPVNGDYFIEVTAKSGSTGNYDLLLGVTSANNTPWRNPLNHLDVNNSGGQFPVTAFDALSVINELNGRRFITGPTNDLPAPGPQGPPPYLDVNGDGRVTAFDALGVINYLNANPITGPSGGEDTSVGEDTSDDSALVAPLTRSFASSGDSNAKSSTGTNGSSSSASDNLWLLLGPQASGQSDDQELTGSNSSDEANDRALEDILSAAE
jgi:hypothetical protein